ncbi:DUF1573 domain-containing protein [Victivallis sp. Marseille-Q1083]|uniref:DUF1573 domain-containing protein n=1 Tax=Victivallis sp. Marseille-Q1083 TaxID=2717288 RepID=UPI00158C8434|nr:DUF1573 domain-containing protein [Victivallis sp. Marseille-Q1083]
MLHWHFPVFAVMLLSAAMLPVTAEPVAAIASASHDFGEFPANLEKRYAFTITNQGDDELQLGKIRSTCGCLAGKLSKTRLAPGDSAELPVVVKANSVSGEFSKVLYLETNDPSQRFLRFLVRGQARPLLNITPAPFHYAGQLETGQTYRYRFILTAVQPEVKLELQSQIYAGADGKAELRPLAARRFELLLSVTPQPAETSLDATVTVKIVEPAGWPPQVIQLRANLIEPAATTGSKAETGE